MMDTITYGLTKDLPGGPIYAPAELAPHERFPDDPDDRPLTQGRLIGGLISLALLMGAGAYLFIAL